MLASHTLSSNKIFQILWSGTSFHYMMILSFTHFPIALKLDMKHGFEGQTKTQRKRWLFPELYNCISMVILIYCSKEYTSILACIFWPHGFFLPCVSNSPSLNVRKIEQTMKLLSVCCPLGLPSKLHISWSNPAKLHKKKTSKKVKEKETRGKDQSQGKQTSQKRLATWRKGNH